MCPPRLPKRHRPRNQATAEARSPPLASREPSVRRFMLWRFIRSERAMKPVLFKNSERHDRL